MFGHTGANKSLKNKKGQTPLMLIKKDFAKFFNELASQDPKVKQEELDYLLVTATSQGHDIDAQNLLQLGANIRAYNEVPF